MPDYTKLRVVDDIGAMDERITIQRKTDVPDGAGGVKAISWKDITTVWTYLPRETQYYAQVTTAGHLQNEETKQFIIRFRNDLDVASPGLLRIIYPASASMGNRKAYKVKTIKRDTRNRVEYQQIECFAQNWEVIT